ncbi:MAG: phosphoglycerate dehydrogenase [Microcella sp.]|uniref:NAD(P)-dependent oxidoreductase n=1 Tax=Microcella sp. TaxID=1913979 RepID=UPI0024CDDE82|nr:NAD(P)-dependent oxidoreductase [Microcella sp.]UYN83439.1 MAG: phosphoglycerate dehydrogenase [Microcella sp.]
MKILVPTTVALETAMPNGVEVIRYDPNLTLPDDALDASVLVLWGMPMDRLREAAQRLHSLAFVQLVSAGYEYMARAGFDESVVVCNGRGLHDRPVAEHALALMLAGARSLHRAHDAQGARQWDSGLGGIQPIDAPARFTTLQGARVTIWGFGSIGRTLASMLTNLGAEVTGVARTARVDNGIRVVAADSVAAELPSTDVLVLILPSTVETQKVVDAEVLSRLPSHAWVVNVGRGDAIDHAALVDALEAGRLGGAALDVTDPEPLPADAALWSAPNLILTPHAAGGRPEGVGRLLAENLERLTAGSPLRNVVHPAR